MALEFSAVFRKDVSVPKDIFQEVSLRVLRTFWRLLEPLMEQR